MVDPTHTASGSTPKELAHKERRFYSMLKCFFAILTAPYRRTFKLYTWQPLKAFCKSYNDRDLFIALVKGWKSDKYDELQSVQVAASFCAGATLSTLGWSKIPDPTWTSDALWYSSLICSIWAVITSISTKSILDDLPDDKQLNQTLTEAEYNRMRRVILRYKKSPGIRHWTMIFIWQFPSMMMSYAWCTFILGLSVYVCTPFIRREAWSNKHRIAVTYLAVGGIGLCTYLFCSLFVYASEKDRENSGCRTRVSTIDIEPKTGAHGHGPRPGQQEQVLSSSPEMDDHMQDLHYNAFPRSRLAHSSVERRRGMSRPQLLY